MKKFLKCKILASVLTLSVLSTCNTVLANSGGIVDNDGDYVGINSPSGSTIYINTDYNGNVYGGKETSGEITNNKIFISNGTITGTVSAGEGNIVSNNEININGGTIDRRGINIYFASGISNVSDNIINITGGTIIGDNICIGYSQFGNISDNELYISGGEIIGSIRAGTSFMGAVKNNTISISGTANIEEADLISTPVSNSFESNNNLIIDGWSGNTQSVINFNNITFKNIKWKNGSTVLNITNNTDNTALTNTNINLNSFNFEGGSELSVGDSMTFINGTDLGIDASKVKTSDTFTVGVAKVGTGKAEVASDGNSVKYTLTEIKQNKQIDLVAESRAITAAFINQGTDLISDGLDTLNRDSNYGVKTFAAVHGNRSKYDVNSDIKINGWSTIVGVGAENEHKNGDFSWAVFYENGSGNYRTYNEFNNEFFRGDGNLVYNGGGIAARYERDNGVYTEGSLRAGMLKSEMDNILRDGNGNFYGYESESTYYGAHLGIGKVIPLDESRDIDVYGKFFHTYTEGDSFKVANDEFAFDDIISDRLRIGARITENRAENFTAYYGIAYEYEFNGDSDMKAAGINAPQQSLQGSSYMAEIGFNYQPDPDGPWSFDLNLRGYAGEREGGTFNVQAIYAF